ncbi:MAG: glycoside hydrolase family 5 protein [Lachnospiraceae bacterium]|nr:glycoside hydrolase family 5 protein [Lachnospiraceae bacterium]
MEGIHLRKRILSYLLCGLLLVTGVCGCGATQQTDGTTDVTVEIQVQSSIEDENLENITEETVATTAQVQDISELTIADISSMELVADMKIGWNLGNTLDATGGIGISSEWAWGNPKTTQEMIDAILEQGFNVIRIPVTWDGHFGAAPEYKIHDVWLARVKEVVDYAYNRGAYVILNMHHEEWHFPSEENKDAASVQLATLWTQIANYFKDYDEHLIFEGLNEPRKKGTAVEWNGGDKEGRDVVNHFAQVFVDTVRATGGNNTLRHLMVTGYAASSDRKALEAIVLPDDDKLIVSVHAYTPYNFALNTAGTSSWDIDKDTRDIDTVMNTIQDLFLSKGIPVIIGEFGAMNKDNEAERVEWVTYYLTKAKEIGVPCIWWDNNAFTGNGENFGLLDRRNLTFPYPNLVDAMISAVK